MTYFLDANICLDLLDTKRKTASGSVQWYMKQKDDLANLFYFSADFITTFYYILTEKKKFAPADVIAAVDALSLEIPPFYLAHSDFVLAKNSFFDEMFDDFEDLMILESAIRAESDYFVTNDKQLLALDEYKSMSIVTVEDLEVAEIIKERKKSGNKN